jgi:hypothetical protein
MCTNVKMYNINSIFGQDSFILAGCGFVFNGNAQIKAINMNKNVTVIPSVTLSPGSSMRYYKFINNLSIALDADILRIRCSYRVMTAGTRNYYSNVVYTLGAVLNYVNQNKYITVNTNEIGVL